MMICTVCGKAETCRESFTDVVKSLRYEYILQEYSSLSDAWRVYQGVALYREFRGIGPESRQLDMIPRPCHLCLVKIVNMAQSIFQVTAALDRSLMINNRVKNHVKSDQGREESHESESSDDESDNNDDYCDSNTVNRSALTSPMDNLKIKQSEKPVIHVKEENAADTEKEHDEDDNKKETVGRPKRSAGRSLFERNPDFALGREFAKILRQKKMKEKLKYKKKLPAKNPPQEEENPPLEDDDCEGWRSKTFRSKQLSKLDLALKSAGWSPAIRSGKNMENEVFKSSQSEEDYIAGVDRLVKHFSKGQVSDRDNGLKSNNNILMKTKRVPKPTRKIVDGLDFRRKMSAVKITCTQCGLKFAKTKYKGHVDKDHKNEKEEDTTDAQSNNLKEKVETVTPAQHNKKTDDLLDDDGVSITGSEVSSNSTNSTNYQRKSRRKAVLKSSTSSSRSSSSTVVPDHHDDVEMTGGDQEKVIDEFVQIHTNSDIKNVSQHSSFYLNNFTGGSGAHARKCSLEDNDLEVRDQEASQRPQRRKRSMEERHPDFVMSLPAKLARKSSSDSLQTQHSSKSNEI